jgi:hypothetical protein
MNRSSTKGLWLAGVMAVSLVACVWTGRASLRHSLLASWAAPQELAGGPLLSHTLPPPPAPSAGDTPTNAIAARSPVETFRELLAMNPAERKQFLAGRPPDIQRQILAKVREYESMSPNRRELRLKATELFYYLWPLMNTSASNRFALLALVPRSERSEIERRLLAWDQFPASKQQELLTNTAAIRFFTDLKTGPPPLPPASPAQQAKLDRGILQWQALPRIQQQRITARFKRFFDLTPEEQQEACNTLSEPERRQIERTLYKFANLSPTDRAKAIRSFEKFARLSLDQRRQFLRNAQLWKLMAPDERQNWRELVNELPQQPPAPPGLEGPPAPPGLKRPPAPPGLPPRPGPDKP